MKKAKVVVTCPTKMFTDKFLNHLREKYELVTADCSLGKNELTEIIGHADVVVMGGSELITPFVAKNVPGFEKIWFIFAGIEPRDFFPGMWERMQDRVFATGGGRAAVVETTLRQLMFSNPMRLQDLAAKDHEIPDDRESIVKMQTLLVVGAGMIGTAVMRKAKGRFERVVYAGGRGKKEELEESGFKYIPDLGEAFSVADAVSVHLELNPDTEGSILFKHLRKMPKKAFLLNNARAGIIPPKDLYKFLFLRPDVFAVCDHFYLNGEELLSAMKSPRPNIYERLIRMRNFWYTGHNASYSEKTRQEYSAGALKILKELGY